MAPPPMPLTPKKKFGCLKMIGIGILALFGLGIALGVIGYISSTPEERAKFKAEREARRQAEVADAQAKAEAAAKQKERQAATPAPQPPAPANPPPSKIEKPSTPPEELTAIQQIEKQLHENAASIFKDGVKQCTAWETKTPGLWDLQIHVVENDANAYSLKRKIIDLAVICHPEGFKVGIFRVAVFSDFVDGLGNTYQGNLLVAEVRPELKDRINWKNPDGIDFDAAFETTKVHHSFKGEWESAGK
jgi:hypothetical protein